MAYIPLNVKSEYSFLTSAIKIKKYVETAKLHGFNMLGISDMECCYGFPSFVKECNKNSITPVLGVELNIEYKNNTRTINLFIKNETGYQNLCKLLIKYNDKNYHELFENTDGLILIIPSLSGNWFNFPLDFQEQRNFLYEIQKHFDSFYIGTECYSQNDATFLNEIYDFADDSNFKTVAFPKTIALNKNDGLILEILNAIKNNETIDNQDEINTPYFLLNEKVARKIYRKEDFVFFEEEKIDFSFFQKRGKILSKNGIDNKKQDLYNLCIFGLNQKQIDITNEVKNRLNYELDVIENMNYLDYFYIVKEYVNFAKNNNISVGPGRGSAAGSLVSYALNITDVNPFDYNLLFERFLNPERVSMPDIDVDFSDKKREEIIKHISDTYGKDRVKNIITFQTIGAKQAIRDIGRVFNLNNFDINNLSKSVKNNLTFKDAYNKSEEFKKLIENEHYKNIASLAKKIEGFPRQKGLHAAGIIINDDSLNLNLPIIGDENSPVPFEAPFLEELNFLKMDILGLRNLSIIEDIINSIEKTENKKIDINNIPLNDKKTFEILNKGFTKGIFQLEGEGITKSLMEINIDSFDDIVALNALYRPGPMDNIPLYAKRKKGLEKITYLDDKLIPILKETFGIIVYQEQIMKIAQDIAGLSLGKADILRRAISKKDENKLKTLEKEFIDGAINNGLSIDKATTIYNYIYKFADYGFNKSHSVSYSYISYQLAYLKANYPLQFYSIMFEYQANSTSKYNAFFNELDYFNITILKPDLNKSKKSYSVENNSIRLPLSSILSFSGNIENDILNERNKNGEFKDYKDIISRLYNLNIDSKNIISLINSGALDFTSLTRETMRKNIDKFIQYAISISKSTNLSEEQLMFLEPILDIFEGTKSEDYKLELNSIGVLLSGSLFETYSNNFINKDIKNISYALTNINEFILLPLFISSIKVIETKSKKEMAILECYDDKNTLKVIVFPTIYENMPLLIKGDAILVEGSIKVDNIGTSFIANNITKMEV